ncbi:hypothetical protein ACFQAS_14910 [Halopenitus salinus]|uniref:Uncharacterized protein n=1 Tax=Halopenitus salinus TaxID=1198295 RepID=A0ABD5UPT4_9EURY
MTEDPVKRTEGESRPDGDTDHRGAASEVADPDTAHSESTASSEDDGSRWGILAIAGICGLCCVGLASLGGGAAVAGGTAAGVTAANGAVGSIGDALVVGLATALPLFVIGLFLRRRARTS